MVPAALTVLVYPVDCVCFCHLLKTWRYCLCPNGRYNLTPAYHPLYLVICTFEDYLHIFCICF